jgi:arsenite oxidase small subunit
MGTTTPKKFTLSELDAYDGKNGRPAYLVFKGKVYDITKSQLWINGKHMNVHDIREKVEETIKKAPHGEEVLSRFPVIGELSEVVPDVSKATAVPASQVSAPTEQVTPPSQMPRRDFFKLAITAGGAITLVALASSLKILSFVPSSSTPTSWPKVKVTNISQLVKLTPIIFYYPLTNTPNILVKLGVQAENGVGPDGDIVAFSGICQHLGCFPGFQAPGSSPPCNPSFTASIPMAYCCCHGSQYDFVNGAKVIGGPAPRPLPQVVLQYDSTTGDIYAVSMTPPNIFGHGPAGTTNPTLVMQYDLSGGQVVSSS